MFTTSRGKALPTIVAFSTLIAACQSSPPVTTPASPRPVESGPASQVAQASPKAEASASTATKPADYSALHGRILMEHLGNAVDLSEAPTDDYHPERRRLYWMEPATMTGATAREFLRGQPASGKLNADVSRDGKKVVFMDTATESRIWFANLDGTGLRQLSEDCSCSELDPAFDPTATKVVFVHLEGAIRPSTHGANGHLEQGVPPHVSWLGIRDLKTGKVTKLAGTAGPSADAIPEQPAWSPDGRQIVFNRTSWGTDETPDSGVLEVVDVSNGKVRTVPTETNVPVGDADWSPDGSTIVFTTWPISSMGSIADLPGSATFTIAPNGTRRQVLGEGAGGSYMPDGRIVFQNNYFWVMNADGTDRRPVNVAGDDLTELEDGFAYIPHWVGMP